jgi:hypothetical protein
MLVENLQDSGYSVEIGTDCRIKLMGIEKKSMNGVGYGVTFLGGRGK